MTAILNPIAALGRAVLGALQGVGAVVLFALEGVSHLFRPPFYGRLFLRQVVEIGYFSLPVVALTAFFTGMVLAASEPSSAAVEAARLAIKGDFVAAGEAAQRSDDQAAIKLVADAIARQAWDEAVAEVEAELRAEEEARLAAAGGAA